MHGLVVPHAQEGLDVRLVSFLDPFAVLARVVRIAVLEQIGWLVFTYLELLVDWIAMVGRLQEVSSVLVMAHTLAKVAELLVIERFEVGADVVSFCLQHLVVLVSVVGQDVHLVSNIDVRRFPHACIFSEKLVHFFIILIMK